MDQPRRSHSLATWRYLGRVAFHRDPEQRCLPPLDDPAAVGAWSEGYRIAWRTYYAQLPATALDAELLEFEIAQALRNHPQTADHDDSIAAADRPARHLH
jgi:hypothetical protein